MRTFVAIILFALASGCATVPNHPDPQPVIAVACKAAEFYEFEGRWPDSPEELCRWEPEWVLNVIPDDESPSQQPAPRSRPEQLPLCLDPPYTSLNDLQFQIVDGTFVISFSREFNSRTEFWRGFTIISGRQISVDLRQ